MVKVLIVEDELLVRVGIKSCMDWGQYGFEITGMAEDGLQALDMIKANPPDIILTDIKMPNMDGLELIAAVRESFPGIKVIVLSCHNELDYVKKAMKLGAEDYILKLSMQPEALLEVLEKTRHEIEIDREDQDNVKNLKIEIRKNKYLIKENLYRQVMGGSITTESFMRELSALGIPLDYKSFLVICIGIDEYADAPVKSSIQDRHLLKFSFINILEEVLAEICPGDAAEVDNSEYIVIMGCACNGSGDDYFKNVELYCSRVNNALKTYLNISVSFGISNPCQSFEQIRNKFEEAHIALEHRFYKGRESMMLFRDAKPFTDKVVNISTDDERLLAGHLDNLDPEGAKSVIGSFMDKIRREHCWAPYRIRNAAMDIVHSLMKLHKRYSDFMESDILKFDSSPVDEIIKAEKIMDVRELLFDYIDELIEDLARIKQSAVRPEIVKLKRYALEHIKENISLDKAAQISNISRCYLSSIFKKETGESFTDYINRIKMEAAKDLILKKDLKTYEAAERVGISDESYFSKLFKKYMGVSPSHIAKSRSV